MHAALSSPNSLSNRHFYREAPDSTKRHIGVSSDRLEREQPGRRGQLILRLDKQ